MRLFVAVDVPETLKDAIQRQVVDALLPAVPGAGWTRPEGRHLTLKFLGEVDPGRLPAIEEGLAAAVAGHSTFRAAFDRVGGFPSLRRPRVLWVGIGEGTEPMASLAGSVDAACVSLGFEPESRPFRGHVTLARFKVPKPLGDLPVVDVPAEPFEAGEVVLFHSQLHPKGARYTALRKFSLA